MQLNHAKKTKSARNLNLLKRNSLYDNYAWKSQTAQKVFRFS